MLNDNKIAVISTGNGGQSLSAYLSLSGYSVALYAREQERVDMFPEDRSFHLSGVLSGEGRLDSISCDMSEVIEDALLIMVTTPAQYQDVIAREMAHHLTDGQVVVLNPGRTFGTYTFDKTLKDNGCEANYVLAEAETFLFACRCEVTANPVIHSIKKTVGIAAHNPQKTGYVVDVLSKYFSCFAPLPSTLYTGFGNIGLIFHSLPILLNITRVEAKERFLFYIDGISPLVANILERLDSERLQVARAYHVDIPSAYDWLMSHYGSEGDTLYERIQNTDGYRNIYAPVDIDTRYIYEEMRTGFVPMLFAAEAAGIEVPIIRSAILWASTVYHCDFIETGRNKRRIDFAEVYRLSQTER